MPVEVLQKREDAEPDRGARNGRKQGTAADGEREISETQKHPTELREPCLSEAVDQKRNRSGVKEPADSERADNEPDRAECERETQMQVGPDIGKGAPSHGRLDEHRENDEARPRIGEDGGVSGGEAAGRFIRVRRCAGARVRHELEDEPGGCEREHGGEHKKDVAPAKKIAEHAARRLAEQLPSNLSREIAAKNRLALRI